MANDLYVKQVKVNLERVLSDMESCCGSPILADALFHQVAKRYPNAEVWIVYEFINDAIRAGRIEYL